MSLLGLLAEENSNPQPRSPNPDTLPTELCQSAHLKKLFGAREQQCDVVLEKFFTTDCNTVVEFCDSKSVVLYPCQIL